MGPRQGASNGPPQKRFPLTGSDAKPELQKLRRWIPGSGWPHAP
jgi:hypothetical protein